MVRFILVLAVVCLLADAAIAAVHVGVEFKWWPSPLPECAAPRFTGGSIADRLASMPARPAKPCDEPTFLIPFIPVSLAAMNMLYALGFSAALVVAMAGRGRRRMSEPPSITVSKLRFKVTHPDLATILAAFERKGVVKITP